MSNPDAPVLLFSPYHPPALRRGDRVLDLVRDADAVVTSWSDGRISWPRCRTIGHRSGSGLLVEDELARAVRGESALAIGYWWGVNGSTVWNWRMVLGIEGPAGTPGSQRLIQAASELGGKAMQGHTFTEAERKVKSKNARQLNLGKYLVHGYQGPRWTGEDLQLLGTLPDAELARLLGRTVNAVRMMRNRRGIPKA